MMAHPSTMRTLTKALDAPQFSAYRLHKIVKLFAAMIARLSPKDGVRMTRKISETRLWYLRII